MALRVMASREARQRWGHVQDAVASGRDDIVVERHGRPSVVMISYRDFVSIRDELATLRATRRAAEAYSEWREDPSKARPYEEFRAELVAEGLLDE